MISRRHPSTKISNPQTPHHISFSPQQKLPRRPKKRSTTKHPKPHHLQSDLLYQVYHDYGQKVMYQTIGVGKERCGREERKRGGGMGGKKAGESKVGGFGYDQERGVSSGREVGSRRDIRMIEEGGNRVRFRSGLSLPHNPQSSSTTPILPHNQPTPFNQIPHPSHPPQQPPTPTPTPLPSHTLYTTTKHTYRTVSSQRLQNQQHLTYLSRTLYNNQKQQQRARQSLVSSRRKQQEREEKERAREEARRRREEWLERQKSENSTRKYMNHLMRYHAKKTLLENNTHNVQLMRSRLKSQQSASSHRSLLTRQQNRQRTAQLKHQTLQNINSAKTTCLNRIKQRSNSMREEISNVYQQEGEVEVERIRRIDERKGMIMGLIERSRRGRGGGEGGEGEGKGGDGVRGM